MSLSVRQLLLPMPLLARFGTVVISAGTSANQAKWNVSGYRRVVGSFWLPAAANGPAAGFPRIDQSPDGTNWAPGVTIPQDLGVGDTQFPFDEELHYNYVRILYTQGGVDDAFLRIWAQALPE